ncbi:MAG: 1-acyl-sn-glycerol-3-phosphate acyltransferase [Myxococcales bacterium]|nr:1-acyl-sn-glycerol-3-phosphate acyltransferase [Myxococcales bacterium]
MERRPWWGEAWGFVMAGWALGAAMFLALAMGVFLVLPFVLVPRGRRERFTMPGAVRWSGIVLHQVLGLAEHVEGRLELDDDDGALVLCNHRSWLDPLLLMHHLRSNGLSKSEVRYIPFVGLMGWLCGTVYFDRRDKDQRARARKEVMALVRQGHRVQVFPEGTRTRAGRIGDRIYLNLAMDCFHAGVPVVCCSVWRTEDVLPVGVFRAWPARPVDLVIGPTLRPADFPDAHTFAAACWRHVVEGVDRLADAEQVEER